jgi:hypothetical protein
MNARIDDPDQIVQLTYADTTVYITPKNGRFKILNIDQQVEIKLLPNGKTILIDGTNHPKQKWKAIITTN